MRMGSIHVLSPTKFYLVAWTQHLIHWNFCLIQTLYSESYFIYTSLDLQEFLMAYHIDIFFENIYVKDIYLLYIYIYILL